MPGVAELKVIELRQYRLHPGARDRLIELFDNHLVAPQEAAGMTVIGQFRDLDRPDRFVWLRGFASMEARRQALQTFYGGPVWARHRDAANATMVDSDDVLLLRPVRADLGFSLPERRTGPPAQDRPPLVATIHHLSQPPGDWAADLPRRAANPGLVWFQTEHSVNDYQALPVRGGEEVLVSFGVESTATVLHHDGSAQSALSVETLRLAPTSQSLLRLG